MATSTAMGGRHDTLVGREDELATLHAIHDDPGPGLRAVLVEGPAGSGKTALVERFRTAVDGRSTADHIVAVAGSDEAERPLGVVEQLLCSLPAVGPASPTLDPDTDPWQAGAALVERLGTTTPPAGRLLVVVEDLHWSDRASLHAMSFAFRRMRRDPVLVVLTSRPTVPDPLARLLPAIGADRLVLGGLQPAAVRAMAAELGLGQISVAAARRLCEHTSGLPLHVEALCDELDIAQLESVERPLPAPRSFELLIADRLASCSAATSALTAAVVVLGGRSDLARAASVAEAVDPLGALDGAVEAGLLVAEPTAAGIEVRIPHPLVGAAVHDALPFGRRRDLHLRAAARADDAAALHHRAEAAIGADAALAAELHDRGRELASRGSLAAAAATIMRGARLSPSADGRDRRLVEAVVLLLDDGDVAAATAHHAEVVAMPDTPMRRMVLGRLSLMGGRQDEAADHLATGWELARRCRDPIAGRLAALRAQLSLLQADASDGARWAERSVAAAAGDAALAAEATGLLAIALGMSGDGLRALALLDGVAAEPTWPGDLDGLHARGIVRLWLGDPEGARIDLAKATHGSVPWRPLRLRLSALACRAKAEYRMGRWDASAAHAAFAVGLAEDSDHRWALSFACSVASLVPAVRGDFATAEAFVSAAARAASEGGGMATDRAYAAAQLAFARGDAAGVVDALEPILDLLERDGFAEPGVMPWRELYAGALADLGRTEDAAALLVDIEAAAQRGSVRASASSARVRATLMTGEGRPDAAVALLEDAVALLVDVQAPFERALVDDALGRLLRRRGHRRRAAELLRRAHDAYDALGAVPFAQRARREAAGCGLTPRARRGTHVLTLTPQELVVARLAGDGMTNREIATELIVSVKTVEYHLRNIFTKLGITSRRELRSRAGLSASP